jgi:hypothetical protein
MPYKINPTTSQFDYYEIISGESYFTQEYSQEDWQENTLVINHLLGSLSPKISTYESGESIILKEKILNENTVLLIKNGETPAPNILIVGVTK